MSGRPSTWVRLRVDPAEWFSGEELDRARRYRRPLARLRAIRAVLTVVLALSFIFGQIGPRLFDWLGVKGWIVQLLVMILAIEVAALAYNPLLDAWVDLRHDRRWGLSTQTGRGFLADQAKSFALSFVLSCILLIPIYWLIRNIGIWWLIGWAVTVSFTVVFGLLYPVLIAPIFNKFTPLRDEDLEARIRRIARLAEVEISGTYVADESRRSRRDNAYVAGLGATRRVVLFDTLLEHPHDVVEQVVAHEVGHWRLRHLPKQIPVAAATLLVVFVVLRLVAGWSWIYQQAGTTGIGDPGSLPILLVAAQAAFVATTAATAWLSRAFERQADEQALLLLDDPQALMDMHRRIHVKNLADLDPSPLRYLQLSHPPAAERLAFASRWAASREVGTAPR
ncbi:MAG: Protease HtpX [Acidimicrobiales bacterium]|nr:Protease HtpX [Acidimicrobiales bacterium]